MAYVVPTSPAVGDLITATQAGVVATDITEFAGAWTVYTPTWTLYVPGTATVVSAYNLIGKTVFYTGNVVVGATFPTGIFFPSLPVAMKVGSTPVGPAWCFDTSAAAWFTGVFSAQNYFLLNNVRAAAAAPMTWAAGDILRWSITYEST